MMLWRGRVWIPVGIVAAAGIVGTWIVTDAPPGRPTLVMLDVVETAALLLERQAALTYADAPLPLPTWTTIVAVTNAAPAVWGGFSNVTVTAPDGLGGAGTLYHGTYLYQGRARVAASCAADRGFLETYTNAAGSRLIDLGPSGGTRAGRRVGGWVMTRSSIFYQNLSLPRHFGLASGWFLSISTAGSDTTGDGRVADLRAHSCNPADISIATGGVDPARVTYWDPVVVVALTNHVLTVAFADEAWYSGDYDYDPEPYWYNAWTTMDTATPLVCLRPRSPWYDGPFATAISGLDSYVDHSRATNAWTFFDGWTNAALPLKSVSTTHVARLAAWQAHSATSAVFRSSPFIALGKAALDCRTISAGYFWTNVVTSLYRSALRYDADPTNALHAVAADPAWTLQASSTNLTSTTLHPFFELQVAQIGVVTGIYSIAMEYQVRTGELIAQPGLGARTNGHASVTAHYYATHGDVPEGETIIQDGRTNELVEIATQTSVITPRVSFGSVPSYTAAPPASYFAGIATVAGARRRWLIGAIAIAAAPDFAVVPSE